MSATDTQAQDAPALDAPAQHKQAISANPFGLLLYFFNAEYERVVGESSTVGIGGSYLDADDNNEGDLTDQDDDYVNGDVFYRFYPSGNPLEGWAFGAKVGITKVTEQGTYFGYGFDVNRSWLLGKRDNFYVGVGFGLKRLVGTPEDPTPDDGIDDNAFDLKYIPTIRIINIGWAF